MNKRGLLYLCFFLLGLSYNAQNQNCSCCISGQVLDKESKAPIPFATVILKNTEKYAITNSEGNFLIEDVCPEQYTLVISCLSYANLTSEHGHGHDAHDAHPHFYLTQELTGLEAVTIQAESRKERGTETLSQTTIGKAALKTNPTQSLAASLAEVEGVTYTSAGVNVQLPVVHGLSGNRISVLNNGLKHAFQNWGNEHAPEIDISTANNITVIKGAAGVKYGPEALSGVILVKPTPLLLDLPLYANLGTGFQTNGRGINTNLEFGKGGKRWSYFANGSYTKIGDRRAPEYNLTNTGKIEIAFGLGVLYHIKNWDFKVHYSFIDQNLPFLRASFVNSPGAVIQAINSDRPIIVDPFSFDINEPNQEIQHHLVKGEINWWLENKGKFTLTAGVQLNKREEFDVRRNAELPIIDLDLLTYDYQLEWEHPVWKGLDGIVGVHYFSQNNDNNPGTQTTPFIPNYNTERYSVFATESVKFNNNRLEAGVRFDFETNDVRGREPNQDIFRDNYTFTNFTASLGYAVHLGNNSQFKTNIGSAFRTPNVAELFSFGQQGFSSLFGLLRSGFTTEGAPTTRDVQLLDESDVELERGYKLTNEFKTSKNGNAHVLTAYAHYIENYVFDQPVNVSGGIRGPQFNFFFNQADALFLGLDYTWKKQINKQVSSTYGLSYLWSRNIGENEPLIEQAPIATNFQLKWNQGKFWAFQSSKWTLKPSYTFKQFQAPRTVSIESLVDGSANINSNSEIFDFIDAPDGYFLLDATWQFKYNKFSGSITAQNLLNTSYRNYLNDLRYFADEPGINILFAFNYNF